MRKTSNTSAPDTTAPTQKASKYAEKGAIAVGRHADAAVLSADDFAIPEDEIQALESLLTIVGGRTVHDAREFASLAPPLPPASPDLSPAAARPSLGARRSA